VQCVRACLFERDDLWSRYRSFPGLGFDVTWLAGYYEIPLHGRPLV
jgi:hypothetical protein